MKAETSPSPFLGWRVVGATFVMAVFAWGLGLYGPGVYLHAVRETRGWSLSLVSAAVTVHFLVGALVVLQLPKLHRRLGLVGATRTAGLSLGVGVLGWALAEAPWQLFAAALLSGAGWAATSAAAVNAILSPWFSRARPKAIAMAYNGASVGGIIMQPLWVIGIETLGYPFTAALIAAATILTIWLLAGIWFAKTPEQLGQRPDGDAPGVPATVVTLAWVAPLPGRQLLRNWQLQTLTAGMALGLFAQTGLLVHLLTHLAPALGVLAAGWLVTAGTVAAIAGRTLVGMLIAPDTDRRIIVSVTFLVQAVGAMTLYLADGSNVPLLIAGVLLFGIGVGNAISLPPLIAQVEFVGKDVPRVVALIVATSQATYAFAPAAFSLLAELGHRTTPSGQGAPWMFIGVAAIEALAIIAFLAGRRRP